jgi:hypothetical protein
MRSDRERMLDVLEAAGRIADAVALGRRRFDNDMYVQRHVRAERSDPMDPDHR